MKKIPTLFKRDFNNNGVIFDEYSEGTEWVQNGQEVGYRHGLDDSNSQEHE